MFSLLLKIEIVSAIFKVDLLAFSWKQGAYVTCNIDAQPCAVTTIGRVSRLSVNGILLSVCYRYLIRDLSHLNSD